MGDLCSCSCPHKSDEELVNDCRELLTKLRLLDGEDADNFHERFREVTSRPKHSRYQALALLRQQLEHWVWNHEMKHTFG